MLGSRRADSESVVVVAVVCAALTMSQVGSILSASPYECVEESGARMVSDLQIGKMRQRGLETFA